MTKPIAGYRTQAEAIEAMYQRGRAAPDIARATGIPCQSVRATIARFRKRAGLSTPKEGIGVVGDLWELPPAALRQQLALRSARGARKTLGADPQ